MPEKRSLLAAYGYCLDHREFPASTDGGHIFLHSLSSGWDDGRHDMVDGMYGNKIKLMEPVRQG